MNLDDVLVHEYNYDGRDDGLNAYEGPVLRTSEAAVMALTLTMDGSQMKASKLSETSSERMSTPHQTLPWACLSGGSHAARRV